MSGLLIAIEGIDQSGKRTQARLLRNALRQKGLRTGSLSFPDYSTPIGREIKAFLMGRRKYDLHVRHMLYAVNKWERLEKIQKLLVKNTAVIVDRYVASNLAYGIANGLERSWLHTLEKDLPQPSLTIVLDISPDESVKRKRLQRDLHEKNIGFLSRVRECYRSLAGEMGWKIVDADRAAIEVHKELLRYLPSL